MVIKMIDEMFKGKKIIHPNGHSQYLAAYGAALECAVVLGVSGSEHKDLLQLDATSRGLGIETEDGLMTIIIPRNTTFPCHRKFNFTTTKDGQTDFALKLFEGDSERTMNNEYLGSFILEGLPIGKKAGSIKIEVSFDIDGNRNLTVTATEHQSNKTVRARITTDWLQKVNYHDLPSQYKSSDAGKKLVEEYIQIH